MTGLSSIVELWMHYVGVLLGVDKWRAVDIVYLDFSTNSDTVSHNIIIDKLTKYGLDKWAVR